jgi:hypothetical protein
VRVNHSAECRRRGRQRLTPFGGPEKPHARARLSASTSRPAAPRSCAHGRPTPTTFRRSHGSRRRSNRRDPRMRGVQAAELPNREVEAQQPGPG